MKVDAKLMAILSDFCLDVAKTAFIATAITQAADTSVLILTRGLFNAILYLLLAWGFAKLEK